MPCQWVFRLRFWFTVASLETIIPGRVEAVWVTRKRQLAIGRLAPDSGALTSSLETGDRRLWPRCLPTNQLQVIVVGLFLKRMNRGFFSSTRPMIGMQYRVSRLTREAGQRAAGWGSCRLDLAQGREVRSHNPYYPQIQQTHACWLAVVIPNSLDLSTASQLRRQAACNLPDLL